MLQHQDRPAHSLRPVLQRTAQSSTQPPAGAAAHSTVQHTDYHLNYVDLFHSGVSLFLAMSVCGVTRQCAESHNSVRSHTTACAESYDSVRSQRVTRQCAESHDSVRTGVTQQRAQSHTTVCGVTR